MADYYSGKLQRNRVWCLADKEIFWRQAGRAGYINVNVNNANIEVM
jgi:hypothetical protein